METWVFARFTLWKTSRHCMVTDVDILPCTVHQSDQLGVDPGGGGRGNSPLPLCQGGGETIHTHPNFLHQGSFLFILATFP